jgi:hypothetical protein
MQVAVVSMLDSAIKSSRCKTFRAISIVGFSLQIQWSHGLAVGFSPQSQLVYKTDRDINASIIMLDSAFKSSVKLKAA